MQDNLILAPGGRSLVVQGLTKSYGSTQALQGLSLTAEPGRVIGVVGPNGAGKSTFVRILAGEETEDAGTIAVGGTTVATDARRSSVAVVHQEPQLFPNLTVVENLMIGRDGLRRPKPTARVQEVLERLKLGPVARQPLESTSIVVWQLTEIARALLRSAEVFLFDEPNSALTKDESERLFEQMEALCRGGKFVFLVSHRLGEVAQMCSQVVVVRDGTVVSTLSGDAVTSDHISSLLVAEERGPGAPRVPSGPTPAEEATSAPVPGTDAGASEASEASEAKVPRGALGVPGMVVALTGPEGGGGRELARSATVPGRRLEEGARGGRAYVPADRRECLFFNMSVAANITARLARRQLPGERRFVSRRTMARAAKAYIERFNIKAAHAGSSIGSLSGGNQQKVALASALAVEPALLIVEEPTRGVDVQTKRQIYGILRNFVSSGGAVVMFVNELEDALGCADCLFVVSEGRVHGRLPVNRGDDLEQIGLAVNRLLGARQSYAA